MSTYCQIHGFLKNRSKKSKLTLTTRPVTCLHLTPEQYNKIMELSSKQDQAGPSAHFVGTILNFLTAGWIIDSGASNHV